MDFFERQEAARRQTRWLLGLFVVAVAVVVLALDVVVFWALGGHRPLQVLVRSPALLAGVTLAVLGTILGACWKKSRELGDGGPAVARALGGVPVTRANGELKKQQLYNIVEEMAIASGIRPPQIFVIPGEPGINAFAAGHSVDDASITVTAGALETLNREELQAVIGHEFSHVLNGDMTLNIRLIAWLYGLYVITLIAHRIMRRDSGTRRGLRAWIFGAGVLAVGSVGLVAGRLLQAAVSRRREQLADASSVQFTRNPGALKQALLKIAGSDAGSRVEAPAALEIAHMFFAAGDSGGWASLQAQLFATHPPIAARIKALDPTFDPRALPRLARAAMRAAAPADAAAGGTPVAAAATSAAAAPAVRAAAAVPTPTRAAPASAPRGPAPAPALAPRAPPAAPGATLAYPLAVHLETATTPERRSAASRALTLAAADPAAARALVLAAVMARDPAPRAAQVAALAKVFGGDAAAAIEAAAGHLEAAPPLGRLGALLAALAPLASLPPAEQLRVRKALATLDARNGAPTVLQACFAALALARLARPEPPLPADQTLKALYAEVAALGAVLARVGHADPARQKRAYLAGLTPLVPGTSPPAYAAPADWRATLRGALTALERLHPGARRLARDALGRIALDDERLLCEEAEILRTTCVLLDVPMPSLAPNTTLRAPEQAFAGTAGA